jgi:hypothetical protein
MIDVTVETGSKRTFATAVDWPGWSRSGKDEASALQTLLEYAPRYAAALQTVQSDGLIFVLPTAPGDLNVVEHLPGSPSTDYGVPEAAPAGDARPLETEDDLRRLQTLLNACWQTFEQVYQNVAGKTLRSGPRGGGRDQEKMILHILESQDAYLRRIGWTPNKLPGADLETQFALYRQSAADALQAALDRSLPETGPRGGKLWTARYFVRRSAWHLLDHAWEMEDRAE